MKNIIKNKKGDIPITIFVLGVLAVCGLVIFSFYISNRGVVEDLEAAEIVEAAVKEGEKVSLYKELGFSEEEIERIMNIQPDERDRRHIYIEKKGISVKYYLPN